MSSVCLFFFFLRENCFLKEFIFFLVIEKWRKSIDAKHQSYARTTVDFSGVRRRKISVPNVTEICSSRSSNPLRLSSLSTNPSSPRRRRHRRHPQHQQPMLLYLPHLRLLLRFSSLKRPNRSRRRRLRLLRRRRRRWRTGA